LLPAGFEPATSVAPKRNGALTEVTDIFTTAVPPRIAALRRSELIGTLGNRRNRSSTIETQVRPFGFTAARDAPIPPDGFHGTID
jgi:hypothetical protein